MNNDYMNGYNRCIEDVITIIQRKLSKIVDINTSIGQVLGEVRLEVLNSAQGGQHKFMNSAFTPICTPLNASGVWKDELYGAVFDPDGVSKL